MKREIIALAFLIILLMGCIVNIRVMNNLVESIIDSVTEASAHAGANNWTAAEKAINDALTLWEDHSLYTGIVLPLSDVDLLTESLYDLHTAVTSRNQNVAIDAAQVAVIRFTNVISQERISVTSVF